MKNLFLKKYGLALFMLLLLPSTAQAHLIGGNGYESGFLHPLSGLDHLLAMMATGIISVRYHQKITWIIPGAFVFSMIIGGITGIQGMNIPFVESGIALSVICLGMALAFDKKIPVALTVAFIAFSGFLHGHAHGQEMPLIANAFQYALGFVTATALLHITGILIGRAAQKTELRTSFLRNAGTIMAGIGLIII